MTAHLYLGRRFVRWVLLVTVCVGVIGMITNLTELLTLLPDARFSEKLWLSALSVPKLIYTVLPLVIVLASVGVCVMLNRAHELTALRAAGVSGYNILIGPICAVLLVGAIAVTVINPIVAGTSKAYDRGRATLRGMAAPEVSVGTDGLWLRQGDAGTQTVIHGESASPDGTELRNATFYELDRSGTPTRRINARVAALTQTGWVLRDGKSWPLTAQNPEKDATTFAQMALRSTLTRERIRDTLGDPSAIAFWKLPQFIGHLNDAGFPALRHRVWFHSELARPFFLMAMVMVAAGFTMGHQRSGGVGLMILAAVLMGFALYFTRSFALVLGENGQIPPIVAAWTPVVASLLIAMGLLLHQEDA